ncbi:uncharacterized protein LOC106868868 [Octopus bimaculoides]|nr:uncharacterized protein LOC106868868 [Octopus bimaculoides]XP_014769804.1 uncharacterized protein LOC106868868 [Octopus bimaculoides]XP_014769805.1 uncharacterized protein LOC106868868 [Octopus bimaculoides]XP_052827188.1 uncharacterized protein LOC106868868 [Octopus bimaculoides]|eukprot:XP_014769802.1 PREDICTED: uncharacterized protein LOC106868868 [Octopus bimaculoides]
MSDKVIRRIPTASAAVIQADQRSSHIISSCIDIMDQSDVEAAMKKSESDTELLSGNVINYSLNTLTRSKKISNLEKTDEEDIVKLREKQGRGQTLASMHINQAFDYLRTYKMEPLEESTIITENDYTDLLKNETENDNYPLASNNNTSCGNTELHSLPQSEEKDSMFCTDGYQHHDIVKSSEKSPNKFLKDSNTNFTVVSNHTDSHTVKDQSVTNHGNRELCHAEFQSDLPISISPDCSVNVNENCSESLRKAGDENENKRTAVEVNSKNTSETVLEALALPQEGNISDLTVESDKKTSSDSKENFALQTDNCLNVASPLHDIKNNSDKSNTSTVGVHDAHSQNNDCSIENRTAENCDNLETHEDEVNLKSLPSSMSDPSVKSLLDKTPSPSYLIQGGMSLRRGGRQTNPHLTIHSDDDSSDDDDSGIYAESTRNSAWICVSDDGTLSSRNESPTAARLPSISDIESAEEVAVAAAATAAVAADGNSTKKPDDNDVFLESKADCQVPSNHKRSESNATTVSENSFRRQFLHRNKKVVLRKDSQTEYQRFSAKFLECEETVHLMKESDEEFGLHILDSHPTIVTLVDPGSPAEKSGIRTGHILVSINNVSVLESSLEEIIKLIQQSEDKVSITVGLSNVCYSRDLEAPLMTGYMLKLGNSHLPLLKRASWRKRWFVLRKDNCLYYYKSEKEDTPLGAFPLANYCISRYLDTNKDYCFKAEKYGARTYYFMTESREDMNRWVEALQIAAHSSHRKDSWLDVTSHNVGIPALEIKRPDCSGYLYKMGMNRKVWRRRYCILKDACVYYYKNIESISAKGVAHFHGYEVDDSALPEKKYGFVVNPPEKSLRTFYFNAENETDKKRWVEALKKSIGRWIRVL